MVSSPLAWPGAEAAAHALSPSCAILERIPAEKRATPNHPIPGIGLAGFQQTMKNWLLAPSQPSPDPVRGLQSQHADLLWSLVLPLSRPHRPSGRATPAVRPAARPRLPAPSTTADTHEPRPHRPYIDPTVCVFQPSATAPTFQRQSSSDVPTPGPAPSLVQDLNTALTRHGGAHPANWSSTPPRATKTHGPTAQAPKEITAALTRFRGGVVLDVLRLNGGRCWVRTRYA